MRLRSTCALGLVFVLFAPLAGFTAKSRPAAVPQVRVIETSVCTMRLDGQTGDLEGLD
jgi:hypothetical protein